MLLQNSDAVMRLRKPSDVVLDIGGWRHPFNRTSYTMDAEPYETWCIYDAPLRRTIQSRPLAEPSSASLERPGFSGTSAKKSLSCSAIENWTM